MEHVGLHILRPFVKFYGYLLHFTAIWYIFTAICYILRLFGIFSRLSGIFYVRLVYFDVTYLVYFNHFGILQVP
jgi:hypothetical protein